MSVVVLAERWNFYMDILIRDSFFTQSIWTIHFWESLSNESTTHPALSKRTFLRRDTVSRINTTDITFLLKKKRYPIRISFCVTSTLFKDLLTANCWTIILIQGKTRFPNLSFTAALSKSQRFRLSLKICLYYHTITKITKLKLFTYQDEKT